MKESVIDILMYLFESFMSSDEYPKPDRDEIKEELLNIGFTDRVIERALDWLDGLNQSNIGKDKSLSMPSKTVRIYNKDELHRLDANARGYLIHLQQIGILNDNQRELVIDRLLNLDSYEIHIEQIKWVVMIILFIQPEQKKAYNLMEELILSESSLSTQ
tara:strand:- start:17669 stop:18148 length:480 start_codon:yes stop_codon:yes gene_type:complete